MYNDLSMIFTFLFTAIFDLQTYVKINFNIRLRL